MEQSYAAATSINISDTDNFDVSHKPRSMMQSYDPKSQQMHKGKGNKQVEDDYNQNS